jgi:anthranilate phosphoribosyltransferase
VSALDQEFGRILDGKASHDEIMGFLDRSVAWMRDPAALAAGARAMRARMLMLTAPVGAIDVCGTGGDGAHTFNISTAVAFVVAGAGAPVAKHGNRAMSSKSGAADVLEALGVKLTPDIATLERCLAEAKVAFLFAQNHHPALRHVAVARKAYAKRTIFNLLGPLSNPAGVKRQLVGVFAPDFVEPVAYALRELGCERAWVVHGAGGMDELTPIAETANTVAILQDAAVSVRHAVRTDDVTAQLRGGDAAHNAEALRQVLEGGGPETYRHAVIFNSAAALAVAGMAADIPSALPHVMRSIQSRAALKALATLVRISASAP